MIREAITLLLAVLVLLGAGISAFGKTVDRLFIGALIVSISIVLILLVHLQGSLAYLCLLVFLVVDAFLFLYSKTHIIWVRNEKESTNVGNRKLLFATFTIWTFLLLTIGTLWLFPQKYSAANLQLNGFVEKIWSTGWFYLLVGAGGASIITVLGLNLIEEMKSAK